MFVRRIARPIAAGRDHFDNQKAFGTGRFRENIAHMTGVRAGTARQHLDIRWRNHAGGELADSRRKANRHFAIIRRFDLVSDASRQIDRPWRAFEDTCAFADHAGIKVLCCDPRFAREQNDAGLHLAGLAGVPAAFLQIARLETDIGPAGGFRRHTMDEAIGGLAWADEKFGAGHGLTTPVLSRVRFLSMPRADARRPSWRRPRSALSSDPAPLPRQPSRNSHSVLRRPKRNRRCRRRVQYSRRDPRLCRGSNPKNSSRRLLPRPSASCVRPCNERGRSALYSAAPNRQDQRRPKSHGPYRAEDSPAAWYGP